LIELGARELRCSPQMIFFNGCTSSEDWRPGALA